MRAYEERLLEDITPQIPLALLPEVAAVFERQPEPNATDLILTHMAIPVALALFDLSRFFLIQWAMGIDLAVLIAVSIWATWVIVGETAFFDGARKLAEVLVFTTELAREVDREEKDLSGSTLEELMLITKEKREVLLRPKVLDALRGWPVTRWPDSGALCLAVFFTLCGQWIPALALLLVTFILEGARWQAGLAVKKFLKVLSE